MSIFKTIGEALAFGRRGKGMRPSTRWLDRDSHVTDSIGIAQGAAVPVMPAFGAREPERKPLPIRLDTNFRTKLGLVYRDKLSGFEGIAMGKCQYLTGCDQTCLKPYGLKDGKLIDGEWFDDMRLELAPNKPSAFKGSTDGEAQNGADFAPPGGRLPDRPRI